MAALGLSMATNICKRRMGGLCQVSTSGRHSSRLLFSTLNSKSQENRTKFTTTPEPNVKILPEQDDKTASIRRIEGRFDDRSAPVKSRNMRFYDQLNYYRDTVPPTGPQLSHAKDTFTKDVKPTFLLSTHKFREFPESDVPEVAFLGRSNVGKSSLLNALFNRPKTPLANTSTKPGRTRTMNAFGIGKRSSGGVTLKPATGNQHARILGRGATGLVVVDMPGYGKGSRQEWGVEIVKYICNRKQLRRAFLLIDADHGLKPADWQILDIMRRNSVPHQIILAKADKVVEPSSKLPTSSLNEGESVPPGLRGLAEIRRVGQNILANIQFEGQPGVSALGEVLACSSETVMFNGDRMGIDGIRFAVLQATGQGADQRGFPTSLGVQAPIIRKFHLENQGPKFGSANIRKQIYP